ncbi:MAG: glucosamine-6-phosphate deaminase [Bacteroidetes bacterium]|nr:glucosamine-6-phosphate deaminase [Bacteroidota bacterium]
MKQARADKLNVRIYENRQALGADAAAMAATHIRQLLAKQETVNIIFAAAASQNEFLAEFIKQDIDWTRINAFHMDEYIGLPGDAPQLFRVFLKNRVFDRVPFKNVYLLEGSAHSIPEECKRYTALLHANPVDITFMGIGENAHLAFNDPHVADFDDPADVKVVDLDEACKQQQVNEGCFDAVADVPGDALTLTIPALLKAPFILCMVPGTTKAQAVYHTLTSDITELYPSTIIRTHPNTWLLLDRDSAAKINGVIDILATA